MDVIDGWDGMGWDGMDGWDGMGLINGLLD